MNITVTHTLSPEIIALLQGFIQTPNGSSASTAPVKEIKQKSTKQETAVPAVSTPASEETKTDDDTVQPTLERVREAVQTKSQTGKREQLKSLLTEFGTDKVTNLDPKQYAAFLKKVNEL